MGAAEFTTTSRATTAKAAFALAVEDARDEEGSGGYTGTIAEKSSFTEITTPEGVDPREFMGWAWSTTIPGEPLPPQAHRATVERVGRLLNDKWGPAVCVKLREGVYMFSGLASC